MQRYGIEELFGNEPRKSIKKFIECFRVVPKLQSKRNYMNNDLGVYVSYLNRLLLDSNVTMVACIRGSSVKSVSL